MKDSFLKAAHGLGVLAKDAGYFIGSLIKDPQTTLDTTWHGIKHFGDLDDSNRYVLGTGLAGKGLLIAGAFIGNIYPALAGVFALTASAGGFLRHGENLLNKPDDDIGGKPTPAPTPGAP